MHRAFKAGTNPIMVATDVAARGLDVRFPSSAARHLPAALNPAGSRMPASAKCCKLFGRALLRRSRARYAEAVCIRGHYSVLQQSSSCLSKCIHGCTALTICQAWRCQIWTGASG